MKGKTFEELNYPKKDKFKDKKWFQVFLYSKLNQNCNIFFIYRIDRSIKYLIRRNVFIQKNDMKLFLVRNFEKSYSVVSRFSILKVFET